MAAMKKEIRLARGGAYLLVVFASLQLKKRSNLVSGLAYQTYELVVKLQLTESFPQARGEQF